LIVGMNFVTEKIKEFYADKPWLTISNIGLSLFFPIDDVLLPWLTGRVVSSLEKRDGSWTKYLVAIIIIYLCMQSIYSSTYWHDAKLLPLMQNHIRHEMVHNYLEQFQDSYKEASTGEVMSRFVKIPIVTTNIYEAFKNYIIPYVISFSVTGFIIARYDTWLALTMIVMVICVLTLVISSPNLCMNATMQQDSTLAQVDEEIEDLIRNRELVYTTDSIKDEMDRMKPYETKYANAFSFTMDCVVKTRFISIVLLAIMLVMFYYRTSRGIASGKLETGALITMISILAQWFVILGWIAGNIREVVVDWGIIRSYEEMMKKGKDQFSKQTGSGVTNSFIPPTGLFLDHVVYRVPLRDTPIIDNFTAYIPKGEKVLIKGEIGTGKSTTLQLICNLLKPSGGAVYLDGVDLAKTSKVQLKKKIVYVPQNPILFNRSIYDNISYGLKGVTRKDIHDILDKLDLQASFPRGLEMMVGKNGYNLSGGQRQIVQCVRALLTNPEYIVLDEITSSIDQQTKAKLLKLIHIMSQNKTIIMVTHDPEMAKIATHLIEMK